jgi:UDP-N-acetylglucosamine 2-epimerase (non-hydrolysing)
VALVISKTVDTKKILTIAGTRPEITKLSPLVNKLESNVLLTGQHHSKDMRENFLTLLGTSNIEKFDVGGYENFGVNKYKIVDSLSNFLKKRSEELIIVLGDTNTTLSGAIAAKASNKKLLFLESGMRSYDLNQIEEFNRVIVSHMADYNFCNHETNVDNLLKEGVDKKKIFLTGSTVYSSINNIDRKEKIDESDYILLTLHRPENVDDIKKLSLLIEGLAKIESKIIFPVHPRTKQKLENSNIEKFSNINYIEPQDYKSFLGLITNSRFVISDSGGVQEECMILRKPLIIPRDYTERKEMLSIFNVLTPSVDEVVLEAQKLVEGKSMLNNNVVSSNLLYGKSEVIDNMVNLIKNF